MAKQTAANNPLLRDIRLLFNHKIYRKAFTQVNAGETPATLAMISFHLFGTSTPTREDMETRLTLVKDALQTLLQDPKRSPQMVAFYGLQTNLILACLNGNPQQ